MPVLISGEDVIDLSLPATNHPTAATFVDPYPQAIAASERVLTAVQRLIPETEVREVVTNVGTSEINHFFSNTGYGNMTPPVLLGSYVTIYESQLDFVGALMAWIRENIPSVPQIVTYTLPRTRYSSISLRNEPFYKDGAWVGPMKDYKSMFSIVAPHPMSCAMKFLKSPMVMNRFRFYLPEESDTRTQIFWGYTSTGSRIPIFESDGHFLVIRFFSKRILYERATDLKQWFTDIFSQTNYNSDSGTVGIFAAMQQVRQAGVIQKIDEVKKGLNELAETSEKLYSIRATLEQELEIIKSSTSRDQLLGAELQLMQTLIPSKYKYINFNNSTGKLTGKIDPVVIIYRNRYYQYPFAMVMLDLLKNKIEIQIDAHPHMGGTFCFGGYRDSLHQMLTKFELYGLFFTIFNSLASYNPDSAYSPLDSAKEITKEAYEALLVTNNVPVPQSADEGPSSTTRITRNIPGNLYGTIPW